MTGFLAFVFIIIAIVGFHEFAHFAFMKLWGVKVIRFSIGFGPVLFSRKIGETEYQIAAIPLGGYVLPLSEKMKNMEDYGIYLEPANPEKYIESKPAWQRVIIYLAGPFSNLLFAYVLYFLLFTCVGLPHETTALSGVAENYPAAKAGMMGGDRIQVINGLEIKAWSDIQNSIRNSKGRELKILALRGSERKEFTVLPVEEKSDNGPVYRIGVAPALEYVKMDVRAALKEANSDTGSAVVAYANFFKELFTGKADRKSFGGPIMIYQMTSESAKQGWMAIMGLMIMLNMSLFAFNLLPIPGLDGGQIYPILFEMLTGIKMSPAVERYWQALGLIILLALFVLATSNDIMRIFRK